MSISVPEAPGVSFTAYTTSLLPRDTIHDSTTVRSSSRTKRVSTTRPAAPNLCSHCSIRAVTSRWSAGSAAVFSPAGSPAAGGGVGARGAAGGAVGAVGAVAQASARSVVVQTQSRIVDCIPPQIVPRDGVSVVKGAMRRADTAAMKVALRLAPLCLGFLAAFALARDAGAQTYVWTDERGVVHAAAEPEEVPAKYRAKAVQDAQRSRSNLNVLPPPEPAAPEPGSADEATAPAPMKPGHRPKHAEPAKSGTPDDAAAKDAPPAEDEEPPKQKGLGEPAPGFEWNCTPDPDGGKPKCEQFEKKSSKRSRRASARAEARKQLGVDADTEYDPELEEQLQRRAEKEYEKTTQKPPAPAPSEGDDDDAPDESEEE